MIQFGSLWILERQASAQHSIKYNSTAPNIDHNSFILIFPLNHLRCSIAWRPACSLKPFLFSIGITQPKIHNSDSLIIINQQIFRFKISMHNIQFMQVLDPTDNLMKYFTSLSFSNPRIYYTITSSILQYSRTVHHLTCTP